ncbi:MAG: ABC transporter permease [Bifidobacterium sp.]|nr:ABC transporter permease [Bifidobacterium sp.]
MNTFTLWKLFHRRGARGIGERTSALAVIAFAAATTIFLTVLGGVHGFIWRASADHTLGCLIDSGSCAPGTYEAWKHALDEANAFVADPGTRWTAERSAAVMDTYAGGHVILAAFTCLMLIVPFISLAGSAARLAGATTAQVVKLTALDAAIQALFGAIIGIIGYVAVMPLIMLLKFQNRHFTFEQLWVGLPVLTGVLVGVTVLALVSSLITLRRVAITPLGVMNRAAQPLPAAWRALIFLVVMAGLYAMLSNASMFAGFAGLGENAVLVLVFGAFFVGFTMVNVVGTWVIAKRAKARARRPKNAAVMIAARRILDNPKRAWRNVSGVGLAVFIAVITSVGTSVSQPRGGDPLNPATLYMRDIGTGGLLTLAFAAVRAAVSSGVMQAGSVYDQAAEYRMLRLEGTDERTLARARFAEVFTPLNTVVLVSGCGSMLLLFPIIAMTLFEPVTLFSLLCGVALCYALIGVGALTANHAARRLNMVEHRADD